MMTKTSLRVSPRLSAVVAITLLVTCLTPLLKSTAEAESARGAWGPYYSADRKGKAKGEAHASGGKVVVSGTIINQSGQDTCPWIRFRRHKTSGGYGYWPARAPLNNCEKDDSRSFNFKIGGRGIVEVLLCTGASRSVVSNCKNWTKIWG